MAKQQAKPTPERKIRIGYITATIWANQNGNRVFRSVDLQRSYKDGEEWRNSSTFTLSDLPQAIEVLRLAQQHVAEQEAFQEG